MKSECFSTFIIYICRKRNTSIVVLGKSSLNANSLTNYSLRKIARQKELFPLLQLYHLLMTQYPRKKEDPKAREILHYSKKELNPNQVRESRKAIGCWPKTSDIICFWKCIIAILSAGKWGDWIRFLKRWPPSWEPDRPNNVEATIKKCRKNSLHLLVFCCTWENSISDQKKCMESRKNFGKNMRICRRFWILPNYII